MQPRSGSLQRPEAAQVSWRPRLTGHPREISADQTVTP
jgi:hypothetical protein